MLTCPATWPAQALGLSGPLMRRPVPSNQWAADCDSMQPGESLPRAVWQLVCPAVALMVTAGVIALAAVVQTRLTTALPGCVCASSCNLIGRLVVVAETV